MSNEPDIVELLRSLGNVYADSAASTIETLREEVRAWRAYRGNRIPITETYREEWRRLEKARARTDASGAMGTDPKGGPTK